MSRERTQELWCRFLSDGRLSGPEEAELLRALGTDEELRQELLENAEIDGWLRAFVGGQADSEAPIRRFLDYLAAETKEERFVAQVQARIDEVKREGSGGRRAAPRSLKRGSRNWTRSYWMIGLAAAGLFIVLALLLDISGPGPTQPPRPAREVAGGTPAIEELPVISKHKERPSDPAPPPRKPPAVAKSIDKKPSESGETDAERKRRIEEEMKRALRKEPRPVPPSPSLPGPEQTPGPKPKAPETPPQQKKDRGTRAAIAKVERLEGRVFVVTGAGKVPAEAGHDFLEGQGLETVGEGSRAVLTFPDGTSIALDAGTSVSEVKAKGGKRVTVVRGSLAAVVTHQPRREPMVFTTPQGEAAVRGTLLRITVDLSDSKGGSTRLEVEEGKVRLKRKIDGNTALVVSGHYAVMAPGISLFTRPLPANLLGDPGFEKDGLGWTGLSDPEGVPRTGVSIVGAPVRSGRRGLRFETNPGTTYDRELYQDFPVRPGQTFGVSGWLRVEDMGREAATISLMWLRSGGPIDRQPTKAVKALDLVIREDFAGTLPGTREWVWVSRRATAPPAATQVRILLYTARSPKNVGRAWFDDLTLRRFAKNR